MTDINHDSDHFILNAWVPALRSGDYSQAEGVLNETRQGEYPIGHCCLGVATDIAIKSGFAPSLTWVIPQETTWHNGEEIVEGLAAVLDLNGNTISATLPLEQRKLPSSLLPLLGFDSRCGPVASIIDGEDHWEGRLTELNDNGCSFDLIANWLEGWVKAGRPEEFHLNADAEDE